MKGKEAVCVWSYKSCADLVKSVCQLVKSRWWCFLFLRSVALEDTSLLFSGTTCVSSTETVSSAQAELITWQLMWKLFSFRGERERESGADGFIHHKWSFGWMPPIPSNCLKKELYSVLHSPNLHFTELLSHSVCSLCCTYLFCLDNKH